MGDEKLHFWSDGIERGRKMLDFIESKIGSLQGKRVLDLGCNLGGISIACKQRCERVISIDYSRESVLKFKERLSDNAISGIAPLNADAAYLPFADEVFDVVIINGVLEWVAHKRGKNALSVHKQVLAEAKRVLRTGGYLYLAIENKFYPVNLLRDPHQGIPLVSYLPYRLASVLTAKKFDTPVYSLSGLRKQLEGCGFKEISVFTGLVHYQYPVHILSLDEKLPRRLSDDTWKRIAEEYSAFGLSGKLSLKIFILKLAFLFGLAKCFVHSFITISKK